MTTAAIDLNIKKKSMPNSAAELDLENSPFGISNVKK